MQTSSLFAWRSGARETIDDFSALKPARILDATEGLDSDHLGGGSLVCLDSLERRRSCGAQLVVGLLTPIHSREINDLNDLTEDRMSSNLHVRNLDDELVARLKRRAARHGRSTEAEHREILRQALSAEAEPSFDALAAELRKLTRGRRQTPSELLLREGRDER